MKILEIFGTGKAATTSGTVNKNGNGIFIPKPVFYAIAVILLLYTVTQFAPNVFALVQTLNLNPISNGGQGPNTNTLPVITPAVTTTPTKTPVPTPGRPTTNTLTGPDKVLGDKLRAEGRKDKIIARRIQDLINTHQLAWVPIESIPRQFLLYHPELKVYVENLQIDNNGVITGDLVNKGDKPVKFEASLLLVRKDYTWMGVSMFKINKILSPIHQNLFIIPGETKSFITLKADFSGQEGNGREDIIYIMPPIVTEATNYPYN